MKRGDIFLIAGKGDFSGKPRPALVVQNDLFNRDAPTVTFCPITSHLTGLDLFRIALAPTGQNGLDRASEIQIDKVQAVRIRSGASQIGRTEPGEMTRVDEALRLWLDL